MSNMKALEDMTREEMINEIMNSLAAIDRNHEEMIKENEAMKAELEEINSELDAMLDSTRHEVVMEHLDAISDDLDSLLVHWH